MGHTDYERTSGDWSRSVAAGSEGGVRKAGHPPPKPRGGWRCPSFSLMHQACAWAGLLPPRGASPFRTPARDLAAGAVAARRAGRDPRVVFSQPGLPYGRDHACCTLCTQPKPGGQAPLSGSWPEVEHVEAWTGGRGAGAGTAPISGCGGGTARAFPGPCSMPAHLGPPPLLPNLAPAVTAVRAGWERRAEGTSAWAAGLLDRHAHQPEDRKPASALQ